MKAGRKPANTSEAQQIINLYDANKDGKIDKKEFK